MYQHLSETAKAVLKLSQQLAHQDQQEYVGTEHILLAVMKNGEGIGAQVLINHNITLEMIRQQIRTLVRRSMEETWVLGRLPGTPHFKQVISLAIEEAEKFKDKKVGTEYLLLGLMRERGCIADKTLRKLGITIGDLRKEIARLQGRPFANIQW